MSSDASSKLSAWSTFATTLIALSALIVAICQLSKSNEAQREATAQDAYKEYLKLAFDNPELAEGLKELTPDAKLEAKYDWFVSYFLYSAEQIFLLYPTDQEWRNAISHQLCFHAVFVKSDEYQKSLKLHYDPRFREFVDEAVLKCSSESFKITHTKGGIYD